MTYEFPARAAHPGQSVYLAETAQELTWMRDFTIVVLGSVFVALCAHVTLPLPYTPVPLTLQDFAVMAVGLLMTPRQAMFTMLVYLAEGAAGLPVFAASSLNLIGLAHLLGPTGGYLMAYPTVAAVTSHLWRSGERNYLGALVSAGAGNLVLLILGGTWLGLITHVSAQAVIADAVAPFLAGDCVKIALAAMVGYEWYKMRPAQSRPLPTIYT